MRCPRCGGPGQFRPDSTWIGTCEKCRGVLLVTLSDSPSGGDAELPVAAAAAGPGAVFLTDAFLERYELLHPIGEGATASVFLATDRESNERVAVKFLAQAGRKHVLTRFVREAKLLAQLRHPNVIRLYSSGEIDGRPYLVSEFCEGGTLRARMTGSRERTPENALMDPVLRTPDLGIRLQPATAIALMTAVLAGLQACHQAGVIHRDLKPENILLSGMGEVRIADLGVAREEVSGEPSLTPMGAVIGTPRYMAPEQVRGDRATPKTDLYAAGAILFEMLAGRPPFVDDRTFELLRSHLDKPPPRLRDRFPELPRALEALVQRALAKAPEQRPDSAAAFAAELQHCLRVIEGKEPDAEGVEETSAPPAPGLGVVPPRGRSRSWLQLGAVALGVVVLGLSVGSNREQPRTGGDFKLPDLPLDTATLGAIRAALDQADQQVRIGSYGAAREHFQRALTATEKKSGSSQRGKVLRAFARFEQEHGDTDRARELERAAGLWERTSGR